MLAQRKVTKGKGLKEVCAAAQTRGGNSARVQRADRSSTFFGAFRRGLPPRAREQSEGILELRGGQVDKGRRTGGRRICKPCGIPHRRRRIPWPAESRFYWLSASAAPRAQQRRWNPARVTRALRTRPEFARQRKPLAGAFFWLLFFAPAKKSNSGAERTKCEQPHRKRSRVAERPAR